MKFIRDAEINKGLGHIKIKVAETIKVEITTFNPGGGISSSDSITITFEEWEYIKRTIEFLEE